MSLPARLLEVVRAILLDGPEEVRFFGRIAAYALIVGTVYWFLAYETAGTVLLVGFGLCALFASLVLGHGARGTATDGRRRAAELPPSPLDPERPFSDELGRLPAPGLAPLGMGFGLAMAALGIAFGPWLVLAGLVLVAWAGFGWLRSAMAEHEALGGLARGASSEVPAPHQPAGRPLGREHGSDEEGTEGAMGASPEHGSDREGRWPGALREADRRR